MAPREYIYKNHEDEVTSLKHETSKHFLGEILAPDPEALRHWSIEFLEMEQVFTASDPFAVVGEHGLTMFVLKAAVNGTPPTFQEYERLRSEFHGLSYVDRGATVYNALTTVARLDKTSSPSDILDAIEYAPNVSRQADRLARDIGTNFLKKDLATLEQEIFAVIFATLLSGRVSTYDQTEALAKRTSALLKGRPIRREHIDAPDKFADFIAGLQRKETSAEDCERGCLSSILNFTRIYNVRGRREAFRQALLRYTREIILNEDFNARLARIEQPPLPSADEVLDWKILPPGSLTEHAREIVESVTRNTGKSPVIDLRRLTILENIRQWWGEDRAYFTRGIPRTGRKIHSEAGQELPDEYLMVILQHLDDDGNLVAEDAVAQSPIAGPHALYIQRQAVNGWDWRELMAYPKYDTLSMGTRKLLHIVPEGEDLVTNLTRKTKILLESPSEHFTKIEFDGIKKDGAPRIRLTRTLLDHIISEPKNDLLE